MQLRVLLPLGLAAQQPLRSAAAAPAAAAPPPFWPRFGGARRVELLDGEWQYGVNMERDFDSLSPSFDPDLAPTPNSTRVPGSIDAAPPGLLGSRGVSMFRRSFGLSRHGRLQFMACSFYCRVFVDGKEIGEHRAGGYVPFWLDVPPPHRSSTSHLRELFVLADNRYNRTTAPMNTGGDYWSYGGLMRSVVLHEMPEEGSVWPWRAYVFPSNDERVRVNVTLTDATYAAPPLDISIAFDAGEPTLYRRSASAGMLVLDGLRVPNAQPWTLTSPQLHTLTVMINGGSVTERFGLRRWDVDQGSSRITLNGKAVKLHGWNHHTQWPENGGLGASPTDDQLDEDIRLLKQAGANFIRGCHYPQDQRWLDRLDEFGFAMWEETLGAGTQVSDLTDFDYFMKHQLQQLDEMMMQSLNHPSIMTWAWFNEGPSDHVSVCPAYAACAERARARDSTRFLSWASNQKLKDRCLEHATLISFNDYPAWYTDPHNFSAPGDVWSEAASRVRATYPGKPFIISETGAGAVWEWSHNRTDARWTQKYQAEVLAADVRVALGNENISGVALWCFQDFKAHDKDVQACGPCEYIPRVEPPTCSYINPEGCGRSSGLNHKGVVDAWRRKKESYDVVAAKYNASLAAVRDSLDGMPSASSSLVI